MRQKLTIQNLCASLSYDTETGIFHWLIKPSNRAGIGEVAGCITDGYVKIQLHGGKYLAHRLAWFYMTGEWPKHEVDHRDGVGSNNRWDNLRHVTRSENMQNQRRARRDNATGLLGAHHQGNKFQSSINIDGLPKYLGYFDTAEEAHNAYISAKRESHIGCTI
jgi:hypothetical protein